ncbi:hypothetical protein TVAG_217320 [Trichomonas vaginalis G3]|uniref:Uncharacterized protein n=1 Tax=Trichomonas vaginalis (strain ATCC PRA-98 / G3) TaxID=412133 RepID=A2EZB4_TRIV3|nr:hypothetical protein TVAGG3_0136450 [Trichomonas vaginalis G3]EAY01995.1 hypothetical protein TVAG_217320 [Trichomonas vaginalis G3]KAI5546438.1 hypothetical protein TVAGG3_0136450 [Trichomonas vaginalis G3]|eukprot:XP_001330475.1 hypothetical protein [Trichomonas vaginalis G3]
MQFNDSLDEISSVFDDASQSEIFSDDRRSQNRAKSRIPVPTKQRPHSKPPRETIQKKPKPVEVELQLNPSNFLAPEFTNYFNVVVCFYQAKYNFPPKQLCRNTYLSLQFTNEEQQIVTSSYHGTTYAIYNAGFKLLTTGFDLKKWIPQIIVWELGNDGSRQTIALGYLDFNEATIEGPICIVMKDKWIDVFSVTNGAMCGKIRTSIIFYNDEKDIENKLSPPVERVFSDLEELERQKIKETMVSAEIQTENSVKKSNYQNTLKKDPFEFTIKVKNEYKEPNDSYSRLQNESQNTSSSKIHFLTEDSLLEEPSVADLEIEVSDDENKQNQSIETQSSVKQSQLSDKSAMESSYISTLLNESQLSMNTNDDEPHERPKFRSRRVKKNFNPEDDQLKKAADYSWKN